ncbi:MAG: aminotransferase class III-fold pyridoxal phosphate-dependent enzyme [Thermoanaerobaculia bacterium]|nr:aminotransferase class III-fold pyridoxal phosphate-dependent enzyme [Thermoanaerobaculia bacterium]
MTIFERTTHPAAEPDETRERRVGIPGSRRSPLFYQRRESLPVVSHGRGIYLYDVDGKEYLDGCSGAIAANLGHANERIAKAAAEQLSKIAFTYRLQFENQPANELAELLVQLSPPDLNRVFFVNSGSEAVESAIKLARQYWWSSGKQGKSIFIARRPSYHGATLGGLAATGYSALNIPFMPLTVTWPKISAPYCFHCPLNKTYPSCRVDCANELQWAIDSYGADNIAAFIAEPIGGASTGAAVPPDEYFPMIEEICRKNDILLIIDDVMTGCGRTGTFFGYTHWDISPDIVVTSKGLAGGYTPIGAIICRDELVQAVMESGGFMHGHTFAGNPLSSAIALEAVRIIVEDGLVENSRKVGTYLHERLHELKDRHIVIGDVRGRGLFAAIEFIRDRGTRRVFPPNWFVALEMTGFAKDHGLLLYPRRSLFGHSGDHVLIAPPLIIDEAGVDELISRLERALIDLEKLLDRFVEREAAESGVTDRTFKRYSQDEHVPPWARADLSDAKPVEHANVTDVMNPVEPIWTGLEGEEDSEPE